MTKIGMCPAGSNSPFPFFSSRKYTSPQKVTEHLGSETMAEWNSIIFGGCQDNIKCSISPSFHNIWKEFDWEIPL